MISRNLILQYILASAIVVIFSVGAIFLTQTDTNETVAVSIDSSFRSVILDAGHGGKDGGAVSVTGSLEKDINLDIVLNLNDIMNILGYNVILTRETDIELTHPDGGSRKMQDLKGRLKIASDNSGVPFVSIHMNKFPIEKYKGLQVYYARSVSGSKEMAESIRKNVTSLLDPDNDRSTKPSSTNIYLLHRAVSPSVLIECGFLSNNAEAALLDDTEYRLKLCTVIASSIDLWYNSYEIPKG